MTWDLSMWELTFHVPCWSSTLHDSSGLLQWDSLPIILNILFRNGLGTGQKLQEVHLNSKSCRSHRSSITGLTQTSSQDTPSGQMPMCWKKRAVLLTWRWHTGLCKKSWVTPHFFIFCLPGIRLSCNSLNVVVCNSFPVGFSLLTLSYEPLKDK